MRSCPTNRYTTLRDRACAFARRRRAPVEHSMLLEHQKVTARDAEARLDRVPEEGRFLRFDFLQEGDVEVDHCGNPARRNRSA